MSACLSCAFDASSELQFCPRCGSSLHDPLIGALLGDRYRILALIGVGGMGAVYRALHTTLKREVAVKVLLPDFGGKDEFVRRFEREAESASRLAHPNIIAVTDFGRTPEGLLFLVMEYLIGQSLTTVIRQGPLPSRRAIAITRDILEALGHAHAAGIVHRDLKPDNIMLVERDGRSDVVKILDFGIAKITDPEPGREALTQAGVIFGTPEYLSPEQALGAGVDARADLYATGVILFEMLTGRRPFESEEKVRIISMHLSHRVPKMSEANPAVAVSLPIEDVVMQALEKEREHRFASAGAFLAALADAVELSRPDGAGEAPHGTEDRIGDRTADRTADRMDDRTVPGPARGSATSSAPAVFPAFSAGFPAGPSTERSRAHPRVRWVVPAVVGTALVVAGIGFFARRGPQTHLVATGRITQPAAPPAELASQIRVVEGFLASGDLIKAKVALEEALARQPRNARVRYLLGRVAFAGDRRAEALDDYREAIALDAGFRADPVLIEHLGVALGDSKTADAALDLAIERVGQPAVDLLERVANGSGELRRRQRAARALIELGEKTRVDTVSLEIAELKKAGTCEERKPIVVALGKAQDTRALPVLRAQRPHGGRGGLEGLFVADANNTCMKGELAEAIAKVEAKLPPEKRTAVRSSTRRTAPAPPSSSSFFRGR